MTVETSSQPTYRPGQEEFKDLKPPKVPLPARYQPERVERKYMGPPLKAQTVAGTVEAEPPKPKPKPAPVQEQANVIERKASKGGRPADKSSILSRVRNVMMTNKGRWMTTPEICIALNHGVSQTVSRDRVSNSLGILVKQGTCQKRATDKDVWKANQEYTWTGEAE